VDVLPARVYIPGMTTTRVSWDQYFMNIAREVATRSTCSRKHVGAVIVRDKVILSTGYNGSIRGMPHCARIAGASIYVTASPCWSCFKMIANAGLTRVVFGEFYRDQRIFEVARELDMELIHLQ
jgi:dCMP deaminase